MALGDELSTFVSQLSPLSLKDGGLSAFTCSWVMHIWVVKGWPGIGWPFCFIISSVWGGMGGIFRSSRVEVTVHSPTLPCAAKATAGARIKAAPIRAQIRKRFIAIVLFCPWAKFGQEPGARQLRLLRNEHAHTPAVAAGPVGAEGGGDARGIAAELAGEVVRALKMIVAAPVNPVMAHALDLAVKDGFHHRLAAGRVFHAVDAIIIAAVEMQRLAALGLIAAHADMMGEGLAVARGRQALLARQRHPDRWHHGGAKLPDRADGPEAGLARGPGGRHQKQQSGGNRKRAAHRSLRKRRGIWHGRPGLKSAAAALLL